MGARDEAASDNLMASTLRIRTRAKPDQPVILADLCHGAIAPAIGGSRTFLIVRSLNPLRAHEHRFAAKETTPLARHFFKAIKARRMRARAMGIL
jgi:hypothetical protein